MKTLFLILALLCAFPAHAQMVKLPGGAPTMGTCGSSPSVSGNDSVGTITVGSGVVTSCALNFSKTYGAAPVCLVITSASTLTVGATTTTAALTVTVSATIGSGSIFYTCALP